MKKLFAAAAMIAACTLALAAESTSVGETYSTSGDKTSPKNLFNFDKYDGPIAYPGNTWGTVVYGAKSPDGFQKYRIEGIVEQGVDWFRFSSDPQWKFNTYVAAEYVLNSDTRGVTPVLGMKVNRAFSDGSLDLGLRWKHGNTYLSPTGINNPGGTEKVSRVELYATYWFAWNLKKP